MEQTKIEAYRCLLEEAFAWKKKASKQLKGLIHCTKGCSHCCHGLFYISYLDLLLLREGFRRLPADTRQGIIENARGIKKKMKEFFGIDRFNQLDDHREDIFYNKFKGFPCPFLNPDTGECRIYDERPYICRLQGIPFYDGKNWDNGPCCDFNASLLPLEKDPANKSLFCFDENRFFKKERALFIHLGLKDKIGAYFFIPDFIGFEGPDSY